MFNRFRTQIDRIYFRSDAGCNKFLRIGLRLKEVTETTHIVGNLLKQFVGLS